MNLNTAKELLDIARAAQKKAEAQCKHIEKLLCGYFEVTDMRYASCKQFNCRDNKAVIILEEMMRASTAMKEHCDFVVRGLVCEEARLHLLNSKRQRGIGFLSIKRNRG